MKTTAFHWPSFLPAAEFTGCARLRITLWLMLAWAVLLSPLAAQQSGDFTYSSDGSAITITGYTGAGGAVTIPDTIAGLPVQTIGENAFRGKAGLTHVTIPNSVISIKPWAFLDCSNLLSIDVSAGNTAYSSVDGILFNVNLTTLIAHPGGKAGNYTIPASVNSISDAAFAHCAGLLNIEVSAGNATYKSVGGVLFTIDGAALIAYPEGKEGSYTIPADTTSVARFAFWGCAGLSSITIPDSVTSIGHAAFYLCTGLTSIIIPDNVTSIEGSSFAGCHGLSSVAIGNGVTTIGGFAFQSCFSLERVIIPAGVTSIDLRTFEGCRSLISVTIPSSVTSIGDGAFAGCWSLPLMTIPASVTSIQNLAFVDCTSLASATFEGNAPSSFGVSVFDNASSSFTIYYYEDSTGFTSPTWQGYPVVALGAPMPPPETALMPGTPEAGFTPEISGEFGSAVVSQADGKLLVFGRFTAVNGHPRPGLARLLPDGSLEELETFNPGAGPDDDIQSLMALPDGKILLVGLFTSFNGQPRGGIARLHPDGSLEDAASFAIGAGADGPVDVAAVQPDGKILIAGDFTTFNGQPRPRIARLHPDGTLESLETFNPGAGANNRIFHASLQDDWKILIAGLFTAVDGQPRGRIARLNPDGSVESAVSFNTGAGANAEVYTVASQPDGKILLSGLFTAFNGQPRGRMARLWPDGTLESTATFDPGAGLDDWADTLTLQADGRIVLGGHFTQVDGKPRNRIARMLADGRVENADSFDPGSGANERVYGVTLQPDGRILVGGRFTEFDGVAHAKLARLHNDEAVQQLVIPDATRVRWHRGGSAPEVSGVTFDYSTDGGANWTALGPGRRIDEGWERANLSLPRSGMARARGRTHAGGFNASSGLVEQRQVFLTESGVVTEGVSALTATSAVLHGAVLLPGSTAAYFEYGPTAALGQRTATQAVGAGAAAAVVLPVAGLQGSTVYYYRLVAEGSAGRTEGATATFTTTPGWPLAATGAPAEVTVASATLVGGVNPQGLATQVFFEYGTTALLGSTTPAQPLPAGARVADVAAPISGLRANGTYHYRIVATNAAGTARGEIVSFAAGTVGGLLIPTDAPTTTTGEVAALGAGQVTVRGQVNARGGSTLVHVEYGLTTAYGHTTPAQGVGNAVGAIQVVVTLSGLRPGMAYHYRVVAANSAGTTPGANATFTTAFPPPVVRTGEAALVDGTTAAVAGMVEARGAASEVYVDYGLSPASFAFSVAADPATATGETETAVAAHLHNLKQGVTYYYRVRAVSDGGTAVGAVRSFSVAALSGLLQEAPVPVPATERQGFVLVTLNPSNVGGWRLAGETDWRPSGVPATGLTTGTRTLEFRPIPSHTAPMPEPITVTSGGAALLLARAYTPATVLASGAVRVLLQPEALSAPAVPVAQRAQWRLLGETAWRDSGTTATGLAEGAHLIESKPVSGHATPALSSVEVSGGFTSEVTLVYLLAETGSGALPTLTPYEMAAANAATAFVGQLRSPNGSGSGFAVRPRVVATAAHVVWDEGTLSSRLPGLEWLFQRDAGQHEPVILSPRGHFLLAGYAAQRAAEGTPGVASPASQHLDAAALFFHGDVARGGFSGYLASDLPLNEYLTSAAPKVLAGYPVAGIDPASIGRFHATPPLAAVFTAAAGRTYGTRDLRGFGGLSGGPLSVWDENAHTYYPAGIYLGGSGQAIVRALDREVVELFRLAEEQSTGGGQNVGGGITRASAESISAAANTGAIIVNIEPAAARAAARWGLNNEGLNRASGFRLNIAKGRHILKLTTVPGFLQPASPAVDIQNGRLSTYTFTYEPAAAPPQPAVELAVISFTHQGSTVSLTVAGQQGRIYTLQRKLNLTDTVWSPVATTGPLAADTSSLTLTDPQPLAGQAFYRILQHAP